MTFWCNVVEAEFCVELGQCTGVVLYDAYTYYELYNLERLRDEALARGMPMPIVKVTYNQWRGPIYGGLFPQGGYLLDLLSTTPWSRPNGLRAF